MPLYRAKNKSKKAVAKAVSRNIKQLKSEGKKRSLKQMVAIAYSAAKKKRK